MNKHRETILNFRDQWMEETWHEYFMLNNKYLKYMLCITA